MESHHLSHPLPLIRLTLGWSSLPSAHGSESSMFYEKAHGARWTQLTIGCEDNHDDVMNMHSYGGDVTVGLSTQLTTIAWGSSTWFLAKFHGIGAWSRSWVELFGFPHIWIFFNNGGCWHGVVEGEKFFRVVEDVRASRWRVDISSFWWWKQYIDELTKALYSLLTRLCCI